MVVRYGKGGGQRSIVVRSGEDSGRMLRLEVAGSGSGGRRKWKWRSPEVEMLVAGGGSDGYQRSPEVDVLVAGG